MSQESNNDTCSYSQILKEDKEIGTEIMITTTLIYSKLSNTLQKNDETLTTCQLNMLKYMCDYLQSNILDLNR